MLIKPFSFSSCYLSALLLAVSLPLAAQNSAQDTNALLRELQRYESLLEELEYEHSAFDPLLLEPLASIEALHAELGDFERVRDIQSRRLQLVRTSRGLEHPDTIALVEAMVATEIRLGNWGGVSDHIDHLRTLAQANFGAESAELMAAMLRQANWYQAKMYLDEDRDRARNFMESREIFDDLLDMAEDRFGEDDPALIPWLYARSYNLYQLVGMLNSKGSVQGLAINETVRRDGEARLHNSPSRGFSPQSIGFGVGHRVPIVDSGEPIGAYYLRLASGYIDDIRDIAEEAEDWETWAMATLYYGDYSLLRGRNTGRRDYRDAREKLLEIGISEERLENFFNRPMPIPIETFYSSFADMENYQAQTLAGLEVIVEEGEENDKPEEPWRDPVHAGVFLAWEDGIPAVQRPTLEDPVLALNLPNYQADLSFRVNSSGRVSAVHVIAFEPDERRISSDAIRAARELRFRPALYDGRPRTRRNVQLRYKNLPED